ncbi:MAG: hypothetical protein DRO01_03270 [Thermoproteota archaeon]|nr:MAG: hypothetical protein DRO01_03270 [Candidatus Korarchaeota archaeon]
MEVVAVIYMIIGTLAVVVATVMLLMLSSEPLSKEITMVMSLAIAITVLCVHTVNTINKVTGELGDAKKYIAGYQAKCLAYGVLYEDGVDVKGEKVFRWKELPAEAIIATPTAELTTKEKK